MAKRRPRMTPTQATRRARASHSVSVVANSVEGAAKAPPTHDVSTGHTSRPLFTTSAIKANSVAAAAKRRPHTTSAQVTRRAHCSQRPQPRRTPRRARPSAAHTRRQHRSHVARTIHSVGSPCEFRSGHDQASPTHDVSTGHASRALVTASAVMANSV